MDNFSKYIYNTWLKYARRGKPWKARQDFSDFESDKNYVALMKLTSFFRAHPTVNVELFIRAPYEVYENTDETFYLDFYGSSRSCKAYSIYTTRIQEELPDTQLAPIAESYSFMRKFCTTNKMLLEQYLEHQSGTVNDFLTHLLQHNVSIYALFAFPDFDKRIRDVTKDEMEFILGQVFTNNLDVYKTRWNVSSKAKTLSQQCYKKVKNLLENELLGPNILM